MLARVIINPKNVCKNVKNPSNKKYSYDSWINLDVKELSQRCMGPEELLQQKTNVQSLGEQINTMLKKNVFYNYIQFIDTAKEIASKLLNKLSYLVSFYSW